MHLNLHSRQTNLHLAINSLLLWDGRVPKRLIQTLNHYVFCTYNYQTKAVGSVSKDGVYLARCVANDPTKISLLPYDNFNWVETAWKISAIHGNISHDQVSAILVVLDLPEGSTSADAARLLHVLTFAQTNNTRHNLPPDISLEQILPSSDDRKVFAKNAATHVSHILAEEVENLHVNHNIFGDFFDLHAITVRKTEEYFLTTYDQEQSSTRGNMLVLDHFFKDRFPVLGDRLTTARDRAAQDQWALDRSEHCVDHLASFRLLSGLMHFCLNQLQNLGRNTWGTGAKDAVSLATLLERLPNTGNINLRKIDFYAGAFADNVILRALVLRAAMVLLNVSTLQQLFKHKISADGFKSLCTQIVVQFLLPSIDRLEAEGVKVLPGSTESGNAMRHAIQHGLPEWMERMLKYWTPMFYAGGSFNYANEAGMFINNQGKRTTFKETDIHVKQFYKSIKSHAHGSNARPGLLEKITPAIGHIQELSENIFVNLGVFNEDQRHTDVSQHKDVILLVEHLCKSNIFDFSKDTTSDHLVRLAGPQGGHARHLQRHLLRSRIRHHNELPPGYLENMPAPSSAIEEKERDDCEIIEEADNLDNELEKDNVQPQLTLLEQLDDMMQQYFNSDLYDEYE
ncbi:hypothetical protein B0H14DRAFT_3090741 [Mycena olivaceomarginata]|nr:hypothetical protein B0H14DRAFT_3090741 [Mycena olivaceomarginata]